MTEENDLPTNIEIANKIYVNLMFCAAPKYTINKLSDIKNKYFYTIYCLEVIEQKKYVIFTKIFKTLKRKSSKGNYYKIEDYNTNIFTSENEVKYFLTNFINNWENHERVLIDPNRIQNDSPAGEVLLLINDWELSLVGAFHQIIKNNL